ncbi:hypothetical protein [Mesoterricola silvestris]|uniref:Outer membrane protein beta-barrel domain-containing protein n=1 Tax=Mesoterricola silvestris TaxID=2927979 RepID=A0AA48GVE8_9BACT|nr:hypothetical protein [Mesoterricola silvestris]BDU72541.1 hypothetical protein METEAL_17150 [Mesoterricola silvestris]
MAATALQAQEGWVGSLKFGGGPTTGSAKTLMGNAGYGFGAEVEFAYRYAKDQAMVLGLGYRFFPGDLATVSSIPTPRPDGTYEARITKPDAKGPEVTALYRRDLVPELYVQAGLRLGLYKVNVRDTGSRITYTGGAPSSIVTIMDDLDKKTTSIGAVAGLGWRITGIFSVEANVFTVRLGDPRGGTGTSAASEIRFGIRF